MAVYTDCSYVMSEALLQVFGINPDEVRSVEYKHEVGEVPTLVVEYLVMNGDRTVFDHVTRSYNVRLEPIVEVDDTPETGR